MPGYADWKTLYQEEYFQLTQEGYDTSGYMKPEDDGELLPFPGFVKKGTAGGLSEPEWEQAYYHLWNVREQGLRPDFPYQEPTGLEDILAQAGEMPGLSPLPTKDYPERIAGALYGRCAGVILGKPLEMGFHRNQIREYLESVGQYPLDDYVTGRSEALNLTLREDCLPSTKGHVKFVQPDDDIHYTLLALLLAEKKGLHFTARDVGENWLDNVPYHWFWCASRQAYYHMVNLRADIPAEEQIAAFPVKLNPWRECIDGQIRCDLWGYISPGDPIRAARLAYQDCSFSLVKNGCYGGMFVAGCLSAALSAAPTVEGILQGGLSVIPQNSRLADAVRKVTAWYSESGDWEGTCQKIENAYGNLPFAATINNIAVVVLSLLHGKLDYSKTITTAVLCGFDTDCNAGTAGSIAGAAVGKAGIDPRWLLPLQDTIRSAVAGFGTDSISGTAERIVRLGQSR